MKLTSRTRAWQSLPVAVAAMLFAGAGFAAEAEQKKAEATQQKAAAEKKADVSRAETEKQLQAAQKRLEEAAREVARLSRSISDEFVSVDTQRRVMRIRERGAMLGIAIGDGDSGGDEGVEVLSVSPGGPAEAAGLKAGDVLLQAGGKQLKREGSTSPREKLLAVVGEAKPGDKLPISYRRDGKVATATVTTEAVRDRTIAMPKMERLPDLAYWRTDGGFGSAELAPLTPKLGEYFGAEKGLLVVRAPSDSRLQLQDGDVILDIDGRTPSSASHALRILGSYQSGEKLKLNVMRMKKRMSFEVTIPESTWGRTRERAHAVPFGDHDLHFEVPIPAPAAIPATPAVRVPTPPLPPVTIEGDSTV